MPGSGLAELTFPNLQGQIAKEKGAWPGRRQSTASAPKGPGAAFPTDTHTQGLTFWSQEQGESVCLSNARPIYIPARQ